jgi:hypothetical protein
MAKERHTDKGFNEVPRESVELDGKIITAAKSTMVAEDYMEGYPLPEPRLHMKQGKV